MRNSSDSGEDDSVGEILRTPFALTRNVRAPQRALRRVRRRDANGQRVWSFDLVTDRKNLGGNDNIASHYSGAVVELGHRIDLRMSLSRRGWLRKPVPLDAPELTVGSDSLRRLFVVHGTSPQLANALLPDSACAWLVSDGRGFHYEIVHDRVLAYGRHRYLSGGRAVAAAVGLKGHLPDEQ